MTTDNVTPTITDDIASTTVATATVDLGFVAVTLTARHIWHHPTRGKPVRDDSGFALDVAIGELCIAPLGSLGPAIAWTVYPADHADHPGQLDSVKALNVSDRLGITDSAKRAEIDAIVWALYESTAARVAAIDAVRLPKCEDQKSPAKRSLIRDAKIAGYTADHTSVATVLTRGDVSVTVWAYQRATDNTARPGTIRTMTMAETRAHMGL